MLLVDPRIKICLVGINKFVLKQKVPFYSYPGMNNLRQHNKAVYQNFAIFHEKDGRMRRSPPSYNMSNNIISSLNYHYIMYRHTQTYTHDHLQSVHIKWGIGNILHHSKESRFDVVEPFHGNVVEGDHSSNFVVVNERIGGQRRDTFHKCLFVFI